MLHAFVWWCLQNPCFHDARAALHISHNDMGVSSKGDSPTFLGENHSELLSLLLPTKYLHYLIFLKGYIDVPLK